jgi:hypothetical protein
MKIDIKLILKNHKKWLKGEKDGEHANLGGVNLWGVSLWGANFKDANLKGANLGNANLENANLENANLESTNFRGANFGNANLKNANLENANLWNANFWGANLDVKIPSINSHHFIAEILFRESKNFKERSWAGSIQISTDWCWNDFKKNCPKQMIVWAQKILCSKWPEFEREFK